MGGALPIVTYSLARTLSFYGELYFNRLSGLIDISTYEANWSKGFKFQPILEVNILDL